MEKCIAFHNFFVSLQPNPKNMKKLLLAHLILTAFLIIGCEKRSMSEHLAQIDSLLVHNHVDSAMACLKSIPLAKIENKSDSAYYYLLMAESRYRMKGPDASDSSANFCINYYKNTSDYVKLSRSYYYRGVNAYRFSEPREGILLIKQAEEQAEKTDNLLLKHKIYESLSYYNGKEFEEELSLFYSKKALHIAKLIEDKNRQAIALLYMASSYSFFGKKDSLAICVNECLPLADYLTEKEKAYLYTRMGELYEKSDPQIAKKYLLRAEETHPQSRTYLVLSNLYLRENCIAQAKEVWNKALRMNKNTITKIEIFKAMRQQSMERQDYQQANILADSIIQRQQKYYEMKEQDKVAEIQAKYGKEAAERDIKEKFMEWGFGLLLIVAAVIGWLGFKSYQGMKNKKDLAETRQQLEAYSKKAIELENNQKENVSEIAKLHKKIDDLHYRHAGILAKGKQLFEAIEAGSTTVRWSKDDFINFLEYYKLKDLPFVNEMETEYNHLSPKYIFFAILEHEGKTDEDIQHIMGISEGTLRSTRSRINSKRL